MSIGANGSVGEAIPHLAAGGAIVEIPGTGGVTVYETNRAAYCGEVGDVYEKVVVIGQDAPGVYFDAVFGKQLEGSISDLLSTRL